jgi:hypothetical protein
LSSFESRQNNLEKLAEAIQDIQKFGEDTVARLRYGGAAYHGSVINYGNRFFLQTEKEMLEEYKVSKDAGLPNYMLEEKRSAWIEKKHKNDPLMAQRIKLLDALEPYPDYNLSNLQTIQEYISREQMVLKINFNDLIKRFENENGDIVKWREGLDFRFKVHRINEKLQAYIAELDIPEPEPQPAPGQPNA